MRIFLLLPRANRRSETGQAVFEFILTMAVVVSLVALVGTGLRQSVFRLWRTWVAEVSAACPTSQCEADPKVRR